MLSAQALGDFEEDHFIPLAVGGSPRSPKNLWPEPYEGKFGGVSQLEGCLQALRPLSGRGKTSGLEIGQLRAKGATLFHVRGGKVTRLVIYLDRERADLE